MATDAQAQPGRELFWRRLLAGAIDVVVLVALAQAAALILYAASDGKLRSSTLVRATRCQPVAGISYKVLQGIAIPPGARPVAAQSCVVSMAGIEIARYLTVGLQRQQGEVIRSMAFSRRSTATPNRSPRSCSTGSIRWPRSCSSPLPRACSARRPASG